MKKIYHLILFVFLSLLYLTAIVGRPLMRPDESRYAEMAREIFNGNPLIPRLNGLLYFEKPHLGIWVNGVSFQLFGETPFALRLGEVLAALGTGLLLYWWMSRNTRKVLPEAASLAVAMFLCSGLVFAIGTFAVLDMMFVVVLFGAMIFFYEGIEAGNRPVRWFFLITSGIFVALSCMTKGLLGVVLPMLAFGIILLVWRDFKKLWYGLIPVTVAAVCLAPYAWQVQLADSDFWNQFLYVEHFQRATSGMGSNDSRQEPFFYYIPVLLAGVLPFLFVMIPAFLRLPWSLKPATKEGRFAMFAVLTAGIWFLFFSAMSGKLGTYILPCFPFLMGASAVGLCRCGGFGRIGRKTAWLLSMIFGWVTVVGGSLLIVWQTILTFGPEGKWTNWGVYRPEEWTAALLAGLACAATGVVILKIRNCPDAKSAAWKLVIAVLPVMAVAHWVMPERFVGEIHPEAFIHESIAHAGADPETVAVWADGSIAASASWTLNRTDIMLYDKESEFRYGLSRSADVRFKTEEDVAKITEPVVIFSSSKRRAHQIPNPKLIQGSGKLWMIYVVPEDQNTSVEVQPETR